MTVPKTVVVNIKDCSKFDVYCGRASSCPEGFVGPGADGRFGNPFLLGQHAREKSIELFNDWFLRRVKDDPIFYANVLTLRGKVLGCWCVPYYPCHVQVIVDWLREIQ